MVFREAIAWHISSGRDRALERIEGSLRGDRAECLQPTGGGGRVRRALRQREAVDDEHERTCCARSAHPTDFVGDVLLHEFAVGPVAHGVEGVLPVDQRTGRVTPCERRMIVIDIIEYSSISCRGFLDRWIVPGHVTREELDVVIWSENSEKRVLKVLRVGETLFVTHAEGGDGTLGLDS